MRLLLALALLAAPVSLAARPPREMVEIRAGDPVSIRADRAYLLFRTVRPDGVHAFEPILLRIPSAEETARAEVGNVQNIDAGRALLRARPESVYLVEVVPGDYALYGIGWEAGPAVLSVCLCLGTVGFSAPPGVVTDLGYFLADTVHDVSRIPELRADSGFGPSIHSGFLLAGATVRPPRPDTTVPEPLRGTEVRAVRYHAVGRFFDPAAGAINRLAPVPGVLAYDEGRVVDVASGQAVPDVY